MYRSNKELTDLAFIPMYIRSIFTNGFLVLSLCTVYYWKNGYNFRLSLKLKKTMKQKLSNKLNFEQRCLYKGYIYYYIVV